MTLKNNRAPLLCCFQLCAWFHCHMWIQTGVRVRKRLSWVLTSVTLTFDLWPWPFAWTSLLTMVHVITPENLMMIRWWEHGEKGVTDGQTDGRTDRRTDWTSHIAAWSQLKMWWNIPCFPFLYIITRIFKNVWFAFHRDPLSQLGWSLAALCWLKSFTTTVECSYSAVRYNTIYHTPLHWLTQNINLNLDSQKTLHISPSRASNGVSVARNFEKIDHVITAPHCTWDQSYTPISRSVTKLWCHYGEKMKVIVQSWFLAYMLEI